MMSKHKRIKEQIFEQEDQFYLEDGDINVRLAIPAGVIITSMLRWKILFQNSNANKGEKSK